LMIMDHVEELIGKLNSPDADVRREAALELGETRDARAVLPLIDVLRAASAWNSWTPIRDALVEIGEPSVLPVIALLKEGNRDARMEAARVLGKIKDVRAVEPLIAALKYDDFIVRTYASDGLLRIGEPAIGPLVDASRKEGNEHLRGKIADVLWRINSRVIGGLHDFGIRETKELAKPPIPKEFEKLMLDATPVRAKV